MNNNKLIAEFMGLGKHEGSYYLPLYNSGDWVPDVELEYHTSWDWLMPVVRELLGLRRYKNTQLERLRLEYSLNKVDIDLTHEAVVDFIKAYTHE